MRTIKDNQLINRQERLIKKLNSRIDFLEGKEFYESIYKKGWNDCIKDNS